MSHITGLAVSVPEHRATQAEVRDAFGRVFPLDGRRLAAAMAYFDASGVETRYGVLPLGVLTSPRPLTETMRLYARMACGLGHDVARRCLDADGTNPQQIDMIITASCTGIMLPSMDAYLLDSLGLRRDVRRLPITQLGCVAGAAAIARGYDFLLGHPRARVLIVAVELPSLNFQGTDVSIDNLVSAALFGDGAAAVLMTGDDVAPRADRRTTTTAVAAIDVVGTHCHTIANSTTALGFDLRDDGFHSVLSKEVPALLREAAGDLFTRLAAEGGATLRDLRAFVLHPGGKRILMAMQEALGLTADDLRPSWDVLRDFGNQSSASIFFVLNEWMTTRRPPAGTLAALAAFGPGLTAESALLRWT